MLVCFKEPVTASTLTNRDMHRLATVRTSTLVSGFLLIDIDSLIDVAALEMDTNKPFFLFRLLLFHGFLLRKD